MKIAFRCYTRERKRKALATNYLKRISNFFSRVRRKFLPREAPVRPQISMRDPRGEYLSRQVNSRKFIVPNRAHRFHRANENSTLLAARVRVSPKFIHARFLANLSKLARVKVVNRTRVLVLLQTTHVRVPRQSERNVPDHGREIMFTSARQWRTKVATSAGQPGGSLNPT